MVFELYTIKDLIAQEYGPIFQAKNKAVAERNFANLLEKQNLKQEEFFLEKIGTFDNEKGVLDSQT